MNDISFTGWVLDSSKQAIYGRGSKYTYDENQNNIMTGEYLKDLSNNGTTVYLSGTLMYRV